MLIIGALEMIFKECLPACKICKGLYCEIKLLKVKILFRLCVYNQHLLVLEVRYSAKRMHF